MKPVALNVTDARYPARLVTGLSPQLSAFGNLNLLALPKTALFVPPVAPAKPSLPHTTKPHAGVMPVAASSAGFIHRWKKNVSVFFCAAVSPSSFAPPAVWKNASRSGLEKSLADGRLLILSCFSGNEHRVTSTLAARRNEFVAALADEVWFAHVAPGGQMQRLAQKLPRRIDFLPMQIIRALQVSADDYASTSFHQDIKSPAECPHCDAKDALKALGYYSRNVTGTKRGVLRIFVRRFRCRRCGRTVSILPSFAQPYRLVLNATTNEFFGGTLGTSALSWLPLLQQYWNRFAKWIPEIDRVIKSVVERSPPHPDAAGWWEVIVAAFGNLEKITATLVSRFGVTLFGRYRCHSPCAEE